MTKARLPYALLLALTLILSACNPRQDTPPEVDTNLITEAPISNYVGSDETVYFVALDSDGEEARFEAGFIKDGKLTLNIEAPPAELQQLWVETLPENATDREFGEGAETAKAVHVTAILVGDTGLMITGQSGLTPASDGSVPATMTGLTWTNSSFDTSFYLAATSDRDGMSVNASYDHWVAYGQTGPSQSTTMAPSNFLFDTSNYKAADGRVGLSHPFNPFIPETPDDDEAPGGDEEPGDGEEPGDEEPGDDEQPGEDEESGDEEPGDDEQPGEDEESGDEEPGDGEEPAPESLTFSSTSLDLTVGDTHTLTATLNYAERDSITVPAAELTWGSSDTTAATINADGIITALAAGETTITATHSTHDPTATLTATVTEAPLQNQVEVLGYDQGPGDVFIRLGFNDATQEFEYLPVGSIDANGVLSLNLPDEIAGEYLQDATILKTSNTDAKVLIVDAFYVSDPHVGRITPYEERSPFEIKVGALIYTTHDFTVIEPSPAPGVEDILVDLVAGWNFLITEVLSEGITAYTGQLHDVEWAWQASAREPVVAVINASPTDAYVGESITFSAAGSTGEGNLTFRWNFQDGTNSQVTTATEVTHTFKTAGTYNVTLVVTDETGAEDTATVTISTYAALIDNYDGSGAEITALGHHSRSQATIVTIGYVDDKAHFRFTHDPTIPVGPIETNHYLFPYAQVEPAGAQIAYFELLRTSEDHAIWIGDDEPQDRAADNLTPGVLVYAEEAVTIFGGNNEDQYELHLESGWNLIEQSPASHLPGFTFRNVSFNELAWNYVEPETLEIEFGRSITIGPDESWPLQTHLLYPFRWPADPANLSWESDNPTVATVNTDGYFTGHRDGQATITATHTPSGLTTEVHVTGYGFPTTPKDFPIPEGDTPIDVTFTLGLYENPETETGSAGTITPEGLLVLDLPTPPGNMVRPYLEQFYGCTTSCSDLSPPVGSTITDYRLSVTHEFTLAAAGGELRIAGEDEDGPYTGELRWSDRWSEFKYAPAIGDEYNLPYAYRWNVIITRPHPDRPGYKLHTIKPIEEVTWVWIPD